jgi:hypothetical protein
MVAIETEGPIEQAKQPQVRPPWGRLPIYAYHGDPLDGAIS